ncbi:MAG: hypothetical protein PHO08_20935 [Methylococcales bacterium]|nr:hypothetical protein [Methylococcales bacterium]
MNPAKRKIKREQFKLRRIISQQSCNDGKVGLLLVKSDVAGFGKMNASAAAQGVDTCQLRFEFVFIYHDPSRQLRIYRNTGFAGQLKGIVQQFGRFFIKIVGGMKSVNTDNTVRRSFFGVVK